MPAILAALCFLIHKSYSWQPDNGDGTFKNPVIYADYPDPDIIRVGGDFYMVSTTFVDSPGISVLHSKDMVNWEIVSHCATNVDGGNAYDMIGGTAYQNGYWASSIRHRNGTFYVATSPTFTNGRIYYATNAAGPWNYHQLNQGIYDPGLFIDTDGKGYVVYGHGPQSIATLNSNYSQVLSVSNNVVDSGGEGSHMVKRGGYYYLFNANPATWPYQLRCSRATNIFGPWETGHVCLTATTGGHQGAIVDINGSDQWFGFVHQDSGSIGRMPRIGPVFWENNWPVFGTPTARDQMAASYTKPVAGQPLLQPAASDDFSASTLGLQWQWNHNPDNTRWSLTERPGYLRLRPTLATNFWLARNTLTQKGQGPQSCGIVKLDLGGLQSGDVAGFGVLGKVSAHIAVSIGVGGAKVLATRMIKDDVGSYAWNTGVALSGNILYLRTDLNFTNNLGICSYSTNGTTWTKLGGNFELLWGYGTTFQGEKFALFCYNTNTASSTGYVDVDSFTFGDTASQVTVQRGRPVLNAARTTFVADNGQPLRGPYTSTEWTTAAPADQIANMKNLGFNAVHLYAECFDIRYPTNGSTAPGYNVAEVDKIVQRTRDAGLYLVMTIGNGANNGNHNLAWATNFWKFYAPRYANETHVVYEIHNEPVAWGPPYSSASATPPGAITLETSAYNIIRTYAPRTPVLLFTYAVLGGTGGADAAMTDIRIFNQAVFGNQNAVWTNEAVGFHGYAGAGAFGIAASNIIRAGYPCFQTEFGSGAWGGGPGGLDVEGVAILERLGVSWLTFQYIPPSGVSDNVTQPDVYPNRVNYSGLSWIPDYGSWPVARGVYGNSGYPWTASDYTNNALGGTLRIEAENFDNGGKGVAYNNANSSNPGGQYRTGETVGIGIASDTGGGYYVGWTAAGDWLEYTAKMPQAGMYDLRLRVAATSAGRVRLSSCGSDLTGEWSVPATGGAQTWTTITRSIFLTPGQQKLRLDILTGGFNLNWISLTPAASGPIANGTYKILNAASGVALDLNTDDVVMTNTYTGAGSQQWTFQHIGGWQYKVTSASRGNSWYCWSGPLRLLPWGWGAGGDTCYIFRPTSGGYYRFCSAGGGAAFEPSSDTPPELDNAAYTGAIDQQWAVVPPSAPAFPIGLTATATSATQVLLSWNAVSGATSYNVKRSSSSGGPYTLLATGVAVTNYTDTVIAGMRFFYVVSAVSGGLESADSLEAGVNPPYPWQSRDIGSTGVAGSVSFSNNVFAVGGSGSDIWGTADAFRYVYVPVTGNFTVTTRVPAVQNTDGWAKGGIMARETLNANAMNAFIAVTPGNGVTWQYRTSTGGNTGNNNTTGLSAPYWVRLTRSGNVFTGFRSPDGVAWTQQGSSQTIGMASTVYVGLALTSHNNSRLCAATFDNVSAPGWANPIVPLAPASLTAIVTNRQVVLTWPASSNAVSYNLKRATTDGGPYSVLANLGTTNYIDTSLSNGVAYFYVVSALNMAGESPNSPQASVSAQYLNPTGLSATPLAATQIGLTWNPFANATSYNVKRSPVSGGPYTTVATGITTTNYVDSIAAGMKYFHVVSAISGGVESLNSAEATVALPHPWLTQDVGSVGIAGTASFSSGVFTTTGSGADIWDTADAFRYVYVPVTGNCAIVARVVSVQNIDVWSKAGVMIRASLASNAPNALIAVTPGNGVSFQYRSTVNGTSSYSGTSGLTAPHWVRLVRTGNSFAAFRSTNGLNWTQQGATTTLTMPSVVYAGLAVTAHNNSGSCLAVFDNVSAPGWPTSLTPMAPTNLVAASGGAQVGLTWMASSNAISYNVKRATTNSGPFTIITNVASTDFTDVGLTNGTTYYYVVSALDLAGESPDSIVASATPTQVVPTGLAAVVVSSSQINLTWNTMTNASSFNVKRSTTNGGPYAVIATGLTATNHADGGLNGGTVYYYVVSAMVSGVETTNSAQASATTQSPVVGGLVHRYSFNETGGAIVGDSMGGTVWNGTLPNGGTLSGGRLTLSPASQQYANLPSGVMGSMSNFTIMAWVNLATVADWSRIFDFWNNLTTHLFLTPQCGGNGTVRFEIMNGGVAQQINCDATMSTGVWHQVAVTLTGATGVLYVDGVGVGTNASMTINPSAFGGTTNNYIGKSEYANPYLDGALEEFRIYNAGLTSEEVAAANVLGPGQLLSTNSPVMNLAASGGTNLVFTWSVGSAGYTLQYRTNLTAGGWMNVPSTSARIVDGQWQMVLPRPTESHPDFYRLVK